MITRSPAPTRTGTEGERPAPPHFPTRQGCAQETSGSGSEGVGGPVLIEEQDPHGGHGLRPGLAPAHARAFLACADEVLTGCLDHAGADIPSRCPIAVIGHAGGLVGEIDDLLIPDGSRLPATRQGAPFVR